MRLFRPNIEKLKKRRDVEGLIRALKDSDEGVRREAAKALGEIGDSRAVEPLIEALKDRNEDVQKNAAYALGEIGDSRAVEPLIEALRYGKGWAVKALKKIGLKTINEAQSLLQQAEKIGINTKSEEEKLNNAKHRLDVNWFSTAIKLANECKNSLERKINEYKQRSAKQSIDLAYSKIKEAEKLGINVSDAKDLHRKAILELSLIHI